MRRSEGSAPIGECYLALGARPVGRSEALSRTILPPRSSPQQARDSYRRPVIKR